MYFKVTFICENAIKTELVMKCSAYRSIYAIFEIDDVLSFFKKIYIIDKFKQVSKGIGYEP